MAYTGTAKQIARRVARKTASVVNKVRSSMAKRGVTHTPLGKGVAAVGKRFSGPTPKPQRPRSAHWQPGMPPKGRGKSVRQFKTSGHRPSGLSGIRTGKAKVPTAALKSAQARPTKPQGVYQVKAGNRVLTQKGITKRKYPITSRQPFFSEGRKATARAIKISRSAKAGGGGTFSLPRFSKSKTPVKGGMSINLGGNQLHLKASSKIGGTVRRVRLSRHGGVTKAADLGKHTYNF